LQTEEQANKDGQRESESLSKTHCVSQKFSKFFCDMHTYNFTVRRERETGHSTALLLASRRDLGNCGSLKDGQRDADQACLRPVSSPRHRAASNAAQAASMPLTAVNLPLTGVNPPRWSA
jgi:hypothetical protein